MYDKVKDEDYPLDIVNEQAVLKLIEPPKKNTNSEKISKTYGARASTIKSYWYADFEADTIRYIHKPYMCVN